jgi:uncharacterized protein YbbK (DUF523 family)
VTPTDDAGRDQRPAVLVSACLLGVACNHRGQGSAHPDVIALGASARLIPVCPEVAGGLPTPRPAAERHPDGRVHTAEGGDVTSFYERGAAQAVAVARAAGATRAIMKARSPSCGCGQIHDGSHRHVLREGNGVTVEALVQAGIEVVSDEHLGAEASDDSTP